MELSVYLNGKYLPESGAKIPIMDHGLLYGDGVFEGIRAYNRRIFKLERHVERLYQSARAIDIKIPMSQDEFCDVIIDLCRRNKVIDAYIRPIVTRGIGDLGLDPRKIRSGPTIIIFTKPFPALYGEKYEKGLTVVTSSYRRMPPECLSPSIKSLNYLNNILARIEANQRGADEILFLDVQGYVSEASADNFFIVRKGSLMTPPTATNLPGVTRETAMELAAKEGIQVEETLFTTYDVFVADEAFITGTAAEIAPVVQLDGRTIGDGVPGKLTRRLMKAYKDLVTRTGTPIY